MPRSRGRHIVLHLQHQGLTEKPHAQMVPTDQLADVTIAKMADLTRRDASTTCGPNDSGPACHRSPSTTTTVTIPIAIGVAIPLTIALILFVFLQRRHVKKLRREDALDKHRALDYGMDPTDAPRSGKTAKKAGRLEMQAAGIDVDPTSRRGRGLSLDMTNPYLLPPGLHSSRESLHSMSRAMHGGDDPYQPATTFIPHDGSTLPFQPSKLGGDDSSSHTGSSSRGGYRSDNSTQNLLRNAQQMSRSQPPIRSSPETASLTQSSIQLPQPIHTVARKGLSSGPPNQGLAPESKQDARDSYMVKDAADLRRSNKYLAAFIHSRDPSIDKQISGPSQPHNDANRSLSPPTIAVTDETTRPPRKQSLPSSARSSLQNVTDANGSQNRSRGSHGSMGQDNRKTTAVSSLQPVQESHQVDLQRRSRSYSFTNVEDSSAFYTPEEIGTVATPFGLDGTGVDQDGQRLSAFMPLPPDDPADNPEQRANRIRSFYKEYFDESAQSRPPVPVPGPKAYYEDYDQEYLNDASAFDPVSGQQGAPRAPFAQPVTRRAMTPSPRAPPRFASQAPRKPHLPHQAGVGGRSRAFSSASTPARFGPPPHATPRRAQPPPTALRTLPTPHLLSEDAFTLPIDFAPPATYQDRRTGRPESPRMEMRPFSPARPIASPLISSFDELSAMPSPHQLRKSGLFTALDFAPPPRFKNSDAGSDAGSIRSGRSTGSAMSAAQVQNMRAGAYRLSRIPKEIVGTKDEIRDSLRPQWDLSR